MTWPPIITPTDAENAFAALWRDAEQAAPSDRRGVFFGGLSEIVPQVGKLYAVDKAQQIGEALELIDGEFQHELARVFQANGHAAGEAPFGEPPPAELDDYDFPEGTGEPISQAFTTPLDWPDEPPPRTTWAVHNLIPRGDVSSEEGDGGSGKTQGAVQLSTAMVRGAQDWLGHVISPGPVVFLSAEEPQDEIRRRVARDGARHGFTRRDLKDLHFWFPSDFGNCMFAIPGPGGVMNGTPLFRAIEKQVIELRPSLVVVDNVAAIFAGNQNDRVMVRTFVNLFRGMARASGAAVQLLNHPSLSGITNGTGRGGNMDWRNSVRAALHLKSADDRDDAARGVRVLECVKNNYAPLGRRRAWNGSTACSRLKARHHRISVPPRTPRPKCNSWHTWRAKAASAAT